MSFDRALYDIQGARQCLWVCAVEQAQREREGKYPLANGNQRQHVVHEMRCGIDHAAPAAAGAEAAAFAREGYQ